MVFRACDVIYKGETLPVKYAFAIGFEDEMSSAEEVTVPLHLGGNMPVLQIGGQIDENTGETKPLKDLHKVRRIRINALDSVEGLMGTGIYLNIAKKRVSGSETYGN